MSVWVCVPSARPVEHVREWAAAWRERGYRIALWRDEPGGWTPEWGERGVEMVDGPFEDETYPGYAQSVNQLVRNLLVPGVCDVEPEWFIAAGDDIYPDPNKSAEEIARECVDHFSDELLPHWKAQTHPSATFGVMQPTGDRWGDSPKTRQQYGENRGAYIDRVCGSAWIGREFARRVNQGKGPLWPEYTHMYVDEELQDVSEKLGVLWKRPDLTQLHQHWGRPKPGEVMGHAANMPEFLKEVNSGEHWRKYKKLFETRRDAGFPGSEPL